MKMCHCAVHVCTSLLLSLTLQRQRGILELTHLLPGSWYTACVYGEAADEVDHADITAGSGMANKKLRFKVLVNKNNGSVAAMAGPKDVTEYMVRVVWQ